MLFREALESTVEEKLPRAATASAAISLARHVDKYEKSGEESTQKVSQLVNHVVEQPISNPFIFITERLNISVSKIESHVETLDNLQWNHFKGNPDLETSVRKLEEDLQIIRRLFTNHRDHLQQESKSKSDKKADEMATHFDRVAKPARVAASFKKALNSSTVSVADNKFYYEINSGLKSKGKKKAKTLSAFSQCVRASVQSVF